MIMGSDCQGNLSGTPGSCFVTSKRNCLKIKQTHKREPAERMIEGQNQVLEYQCLVLILSSDFKLPVKLFYYLRQFYLGFLFLAMEQILMDALAILSSLQKILECV